MKKELFRFRSVFVRETRVERASRGACDLTILSVDCVDVKKVLDCAGSTRGRH